MVLVALVNLAVNTADRPQIVAVRALCPCECVSVSASVCLSFWMDAEKLLCLLSASHRKKRKKLRMSVFQMRENVCSFIVWLVSFKCTKLEVI